MVLISISLHVFGFYHVVTVADNVFPGKYMVLIKY
jgi:hypothetical protein